MSDLISKPGIDILPELSGVSIPVPFSSASGLSLLFANIAVSGRGAVPYRRAIPTADYMSGIYSFPVPDGYIAAPYQLPMLEPQRWDVSADIITAYSPVALYQIGNKSYVNDQGISVPADYMPTTFPVIIYPNDYTTDDGALNPLQPNQSVVIRVYKNAGIGIDWAASNILNNGLPDEAIRNATVLTFVVSNVLGTYTVSEWITPDFTLTNLSAIKTTAKNNLAAIINELYDSIKTGSSFIVNEIRRFALNYNLTDPKYLLCDGSEIDPLDYPALRLTPKIRRVASFNLPTPGTGYTLQKVFCSDNQPGVMLVLYGHTSGMYIYRSLNSGASWDSGVLLPDSVNFNVNFITESGFNFIVAGASANSGNYARIYTYNGTNWAPKFTGVLNTYFYTGAVNGSAIVVTGQRVACHSIDGGNTWIQSETWPDQTTASQMYYNNGRFIAANAITGQFNTRCICYSDDNGANWTVVFSGVTYIVAVNQNTLLGFYTGYFSLSTNNGTTWTSLTAIPSGGSLTAAATPTHPIYNNGRVAIGLNLGLGGPQSGIYYTDDLGATWKLMTVPGLQTPSASPCGELSLIGGLLVLAGATDTNTFYLFQSTDNGLTWANTNVRAADRSAIIRMVGSRPVVRYINTQWDVSYVNNPWGTLPSLTDTDTHSYIKALE